ncbi:MAG: aminoglycoside phosphotransferase family protein [Chloroflexi bacterium]|nr:aminoglycoside phosphotransferase family protein [Chloroflexota bacterium]
MAGRKQSMRLHADMIVSDVALVRHLLTVRFPQWASLPIRRFASSGTDNAIYRLGNNLAVRLPIRPGATEQLSSDARWLPFLAPHLPLGIPEVVATSDPVEASGTHPGFAWPWGIYRWIDGEAVTLAGLAEPVHDAAVLASFLRALQAIDPTGGTSPGPHNSGRGMPLAGRDARTRACIGEMHEMIDTDAVTASWDASLAVPAWSGSPRWIHGDIHQGNLLMARGGSPVSVPRPTGACRRAGLALSAVIDFGCLGIGDPAVDLMVAWVLFDRSSRKVFREGLQVDDATWIRGRGWALSWALMYVPYYRLTNPAGVEVAMRTISEVLSDTWRRE